LETFATSVMTFKGYGLTAGDGVNTLLEKVVWNLKSCCWKFSLYLWGLSRL